MAFEASKMSKAAAEAYSTSDSDSDDDSDAFRRPATDPTAGEFSEFQPHNHNHARKRRRTGRSAKESAALGIFGSDSEDEGAGGRRWKRKPLRKQGVSFVTGDHENEEEEDDDDNDDDEYGEEDDVHVGLGFSQNAPKQAFTFAPPHVDAQNPLGRGFVPSSASDPVLRVVEDTQPSKPAIVPRPSAFSARSSTGAASRKGGGGPAPINASSFGARMMAKMGYKAGEGLGREGQGRNIIIEANLRPQGAGLGAVKEKSDKERQEEKRQARLRGEVVVDSEEEEEKKRRRRKKMVASGTASGTGTGTGTSTPRRQKPKYMTMDEVRRAAPGLQIPEAFSPILDMTGPGHKMLTSASGLMTPGGGEDREDKEDKATAQLARRAQNDFLAILEEWQSLQNRKAYAELQAQQLRQELAELEGQLQGHQAMADAFGRLAVQDSDDSDDSWQAKWVRTVAQLQAATATMPETARREMQDELASIGVAALHPLLKQAVDAWEPLADATLGPVVGDLTALQGLLSPDQGAGHRTATPYEAMLYKIWLPRMARTVRQWDVQDPDGLLAVYEAWAPLLPAFALDQLLAHDIVRKLDEAVARWEPRRRSSQRLRHLPHIWLFPWLPHLPARHLDPRSADGLVAAVKRKFRQLVDAWEFYRGVVPGLVQWRDVLRPHSDSDSGSSDQWRPLVVAHVLPAMARYLRAQFRVDPRDQAAYLEVLTGELQWLTAGLVAPALLAEVLVAELFPMWHDALYRLLTTPGLVSLDQVAQWLQWWVEAVLPPEIRQLAPIAAEFERGLAMVHEALDLGGDPVQVRASLAPPKKGPALPHERSRERHHDRHHDRHHRHHHRAEVPAPAPSAPEEMSIRHYTEEWCETHDLQFLPERKKVHAAGPLYRITARGDGKGGVLVYVQGVRLYVDTKQGPLEIRVDRPADWERLLAMAQ